MKIIFVQSFFDDFSFKLEKIISSIETECDCAQDFHSVLMLINKLNFYAENFFVDNELAYKNDSQKLNLIKTQSKIFFSFLKNYQQRYENGDKKVLYEIKDFLTKWKNQPFFPIIKDEEKL